MTNESVPVSVLDSIPLFDSLDPRQRAALAAMSTLATFATGADIFHEGDSQDNLYVVLEGRVALEIHVPNRGRLRILTVESNEFLGWSSVAGNSPRRTATARAVCESRLLAIDAAKLRAACDSDCSLGLAMMRHIANVVAGRLVSTRMQLLDMFAQSTPEESHG